MKINIGIYGNFKKNSINYNIYKIYSYKIDELKKYDYILILKKNDELINICNNNNIPYIYDINYKQNIIDLIELINKNDKIFSVLVPNYNNSNFIEKTITSIFNQTYKNYNIFCIDDNSSDNSLEIFNKYINYKNIQIIKNEKNIGKFSSLNKILSSLKSDYFLILDSDDILVSNRLLNDLYYFIKYDNLLAVKTKYFRYDINNNNILTNKTWGDNIITYKKEVIDKIGTYMENRFGGDTEYYYRFINFYGDKYIYNNDLLTYVASYKNNITNLTNIYKSNKRIHFRKYIFNLYKTQSIENFINKNFIINKNINDNIKLEDYHKFYIDLINITDKKILETHWKTVGNKQGRLQNCDIFDKDYPNFNFEEYSIKNPYGIIFKYILEIMGWNYIKEKNEYKSLLIKNNRITKNICNISYVVDLEICIKKNDIKYIYISEEINDLDKKILEKYNLSIYNNNSDIYEKTLFYGLFNIKDYEIICNHFEKPYLLWHGTEFNYNIDIHAKIKEYVQIIHILTSDEIYKNFISFNYIK